MGDKEATSVVAYTQSECTGFLNDTARSFLRRHADPGSLLGQLKMLLTRGDLSGCKNLITLICEEMHPLSEISDLFILRAQIAFMEDDRDGVDQHLQQAKLLNGESVPLKDFEKLKHAHGLLLDGCYEDGEQALSELIQADKLTGFASFVLGYHQLFRTRNIEAGVFNLQSAVEFCPGFLRAWAALGLAYNRLGHRERAQEAFVRCIELETDPEKLAFYKGQLAS